MIILKESEHIKMNRFEQMKQQLKQGVTVIVAPLLYPTPPQIADQMAQHLEASQFHRILEPSAGLGALIDAVEYDGKYQHDFTLVEKDFKLYQNLKNKYLNYNVLNEDFLNYKPVEGFDRIIMNPPFNGGQDIKHIKHALNMLNKRGRLVAICANGPRQQKELKQLCCHWEELPQGTFKDAGTMVNTILLIIEKD